MVIVLNAPPPKKNTLGRIGAGLGKGLGEGLTEGIEEKKEQKKLYDQRQHELERMQLAEQLKGKRELDYLREQQAQQLRESSQNLDLQENEYNTIQQLFGKKAADLYKASPVGGKTQLLGNLLEGAQRGINFEDLLKNVHIPESNEIAEESEEKIRPSKNKFIDFDKGLTPSERTKRQDSRYSQNLPLFQESQKKLKSYDIEKEELDILEELSPQIKAIERLNINPSTGQLLIPALASPEAQRFVKTVNDFTTRAKDSYGSRVTNFDLDQFMKRLPTLANSDEGRKQIIEQMKLLNSMNVVYEDTLHDIINQHGGIRNIDYDQAEQMTNKQIKPELEKTKMKFKEIGRNQDKFFEKKIADEKSIVPKGKVAVERADGTRGYIPKEKLKNFLKISGNKAL